MASLSRAGHGRAERVDIGRRGRLPGELLRRRVAGRPHDGEPAPSPLGRRDAIEVDEDGGVIVGGAEHYVRWFDVAVDDRRDSRLQVDEEVEERLEHTGHFGRGQATVVPPDALLESAAVVDVSHENEAPGVVLLERVDLRQERVRQRHQHVSAPLEQLA